MRKIIETCPTCHDRSLTISEVICDACGTQVRSRYSPCPFCTLSEEEQTFLLLFVRSSGNLKDVEKTLGVSYPTVRAKLDYIIDRLTTPLPPAPARDRKAVLDLVQSGQLGTAEALALLRGPVAAPTSSIEVTE
jgi:hypothetical protein